MGELSGPREADLAGGKGRAAAGEHGSVLRAGEGRRNTPESSGVGSGGEGFVGGGREQGETSERGRGRGVWWVFVLFFFFFFSSFSLDGWMWHVVWRDGWIDVSHVINPCHNWFHQ